MTGLLARELDARWRELYRELHSGRDLSPAARLRTEGVMEAAALSGEASPAELQAAMDRAYTAVYGHPLASDFGEDWREFYPFPQIPGVMRRAPVWPSTRD